MKKSTLRLSSLLLALMLALSLAACNTGTTTTSSEPETSVESSAPETPSGTEEEDKYTSLDDFQLFDESGKLIRTGRGDIGTTGVVASSRYEASKIGAEIMQQGGNAFDAMVAVSFALGLTDPAMTGPGGGGFMTAYIAETGETKFINFREVAPSAATPAMWEMGDDNQVVDNAKVLGGKSQGVPGNVAGFLYILENYGTMDRETVIRPAHDLAVNGITVTPTFLKDVDGSGDRLKYPEFADLYLDDGFPYQLGSIFYNTPYAELMEILIEQGHDGFYTGPVAEAVVAANNKYDGLMTLEDMAAYKVTELEPVRGSYRGYEIISSPPPSSGGAVVLEILNIMENFDVSAMEPNSVEKLHLLGEAFDLAYADRNAYMGDPNYVDVPLDGMINKEYAALLAGTIDMEKVSDSNLTTTPFDFESETTTHFSIADKDGNMVAVTFTNNYGFGSGVVVEEYGFVLNNQMDDFVFGPDHPNSIEGGKVPLSSMSPTIVLDPEGKPYMVLGSPGATTIIATVVEVLSNVIDHGMDLQDAVNLPRIRYDGNNTIGYENTLDPAIVEALREMGHEMVEYSEYGLANSIIYLEDGTMQGAGDPRRDSKAIGF